MGILENANAIPTAAAADFYTYQIAKSVRLEGATPNYLSKTFAGAGDRKTWTFSIWLKRALIDGNIQTFLSSYNGSGSEGGWFSASDVLDTNTANGGAQITTNALYRDISAWYHIVWRYDTTQEVDTNRERLYVNGTLQTLSYSGYPSKDNAAGQINNAGNCEIGRHIYNTRYPFSGYFAEIVFCDGESYAPTEFGESKNGVWIPKDPSGLTFGGNGYWLDMADNTAFGNDVSGNNNDWTSNGFATTDQMLDTPTFDSSSNGGNFCTLNPLGKQGGGTKSGTCTEGNLLTANADYSQIATFGLHEDMGGKWYWEAYCPTSSPSGLGIGIANHQCNSSTAFGYNSPASGTGADMIGYYSADSNGALHSGVTDGTYADSNYGSNFNSAEIIGIAVDVDNGKIWFSNGGVWQESGDPAAGSDPARGAGGAVTTAMDFSITWYPMFANWAGSSRAMHFNFGQDSSFSSGKSSGSANAADDNGYGDFYYDVPAGFMTLCAANLSGDDPTDTTDAPIETSMSFTGNADADGSFVYLAGVPTAGTINSNTITFGTDADKWANGMKLRTSSTSYNSTGDNTVAITSVGSIFRFANAQTNE